MEKRPGLLVAIEGIDAVGKRTQSSLLGAWLRSKKVSTSTLSFPDYGTVIGREIKAFLAGSRAYSLEVGHMLYAVNRWEKKKEIESLREKSEVLIVNRYSPSNFAYGSANGLDLDWLVGLEEGLPEPDLVIVLDAPPSSVYSRRGPDKDVYERNTGLQERVRDAYLSLAEKFGWKVVDAAQGIESTNEALTAAVAEALAARGRSV